MKLGFKKKKEKVVFEQKGMPRTKPKAGQVFSKIQRTPTGTRRPGASHDTNRTSRLTKSNISDTFYFYFFIIEKNQKLKNQIENKIIKLAGDPTPSWSWSSFFFFLFLSVLGKATS
jgi:hypothetical protein